MAERQSTEKTTKKAAESTATADKTFTGLTDEERAAMKERTGELKAEARSSKKKADGEADVLAKIDEGLAALDEAMPRIAGTLAYLIPLV